MSFHRNAKLGLAGRYALVSAIAEGMTLKQAAACFSVSPATAHRWWHRWIDASEEARASLSCLLDRSSRPQRSPRQLAPELAEIICVPPQYGLGAAAGRWRDRLLPLNGLEGAQAGRHLAAAQADQGAGQPLRVALPRRPRASAGSTASCASRSYRAPRAHPAQPAPPRRSG